MRELILGGQKSGKSRLAEDRARAWLAQSPTNKALVIATGLAYDDEMRQRIARHQADRRARLPALRCVEEPVQLGAALHVHSDAQTLVVIDCLTMWLTNLLMPAPDTFLKQKDHIDGVESAQSAMNFVVSLEHALKQASGPVVMVSNEIGLGVIPLGREVRQFVDELGKLNQALAAQCERVTLMAAGCALPLKG
ncbi:bifunctional adenosylcobinamide kinase/adenosylcobinamide-phosphate guanylyltransferase [Variovorax sp. PCZ-1]|uniref:bifunctional adenosylcobinamide kinase/adenosylcobinamide-phosphate guanylyltransferase n=1 Tax=Variovorax sp. PCZ-1 TaxID=2835533 RepID=UPI001BCB6447|nr:bifunctional adenosylcobinamide kinase/adenosylcobinamide-phosphate guanylyltransferase [Variovorax sp. PCZ-1]MBS7807003.1 bifunctional adenosylcobinamide kinase/adenosylcobinamide-phosphate guanylyltransferase [Variovorax sp. PCZ-1]